MTLLLPWEPASIRRSLWVLKENQGNACVAALFKPPETLAFDLMETP